jgi:hypothetical protein
MLEAPSGTAALTALRTCDVCCWVILGDVNAVLAVPDLLTAHEQAVVVLRVTQ